jgi:hypothetical protein
MKLTQLAPDLIASGMNRFLDAWARRAERTGDTVGALYAPPRGASGIHSEQRRPARVREGSNGKALAVGAAVVAAAVGFKLLRSRGDQ